MSELVMRSYYVDSDIERQLDEHAYANGFSKTTYIRIALAFTVEILKKSGGKMSAEEFQQELDKLLK